MNYAIIAAGEGSRLANEGFLLPKPMVDLHGEMLIDRLIRIFSDNNPESIHIIVNEHSEILEAHLAKSNHPFPINIIRKTTPSSLHSFSEVVKAAGNLSNLCLTTTDTVFKESAFRSFIEHFENDSETDGLMAVTTFVDDESPLFVDVAADLIITGFADKNDNQTAFISGGIYCLRDRALKIVPVAVAGGTSRMRNFQRMMLDMGLRLRAYPFAKIVDVDHVADIQTAENFLLEESVIQIIESN